ncbi:FtsQ-type POTRA domain-containing protein [Intrasporangium sp. DVR]|uniref:cell division protein FtsQ/DivIB n=1 Tax=Intrasporangium sp. DVR TaxID=3127867 RepID=UPI00313A557E
MRLLTRARAGEEPGRGLPSARARFERRAARARRRPLLIALVLTLVTAVVGGVVWLGYFSSLLLAERVEVRGVSTWQARAVRDVAAVPLGGPVMRVDTAAASARLEQDRRWVHVSVSRSLPHSVVIEVTPRVAVLGVRLPSGAVDLYDLEGVAFRTVDTAPTSLPVVSSTGGSASEDGVKAVLQALAVLDPDLRRAVDDVTISGGDRVTFTVAAPGGVRTVRWGGPGDAAVKAKLVALLVKQPGQTIDVTVPEAPVTR